MKIVHDERLDVLGLQSLTVKPDLFAKGEEKFWDDPHISKGMLEAHLDPDWEAASRKPDTIAQTVEWVVNQCHLSVGDSVLDLGCGPGLYTSRLAALGLSVTGVDYSRRSIEYAKGEAERTGQSISYVYQDYRTLHYEAAFDTATLIYYDLGVLSDPDRDQVLGNVYRALKPGGRFVFDLLTPAARKGEADAAPRDWAVYEKGFWKPGPHMVLSQTFHYPESYAYLDQHVVIEEDGTVSLYRIWEQTYSLDRITGVLRDHGFGIQMVAEDLTGTPFKTGSKSLGIIARKL